MVALQLMRASNGRIATALPPGLVAVFVGATSGIGETSMRQFARYANRPRIYFIGRSVEAAERIKKDLRVLNAEGTYTFMQSDTSLLKNVDAVCQEIKAKESTINLLFLCSGTLEIGTETEEGLHLFTSLTYYSRIRFAANLLPHIRHASALRRVCTVFAAGKEGPVFPDDLGTWKLGPIDGRGHLSSMMTMALECLAVQYPDVSFIHDYPGFVKTNLGRSMKGPVQSAAKAMFKVVGLFLNIPYDEVGERHTFFATSGRYPPREASFGGDGGKADGVPAESGQEIAAGTDGEAGGGVYSIHYDGEVSGPKVVALLAEFRKDGTMDKVWKHTQDEFVKATGSATI